MQAFETALSLLPESLRMAAGPHRNESVEEIRLRIGQKPTLLIGGNEHPFLDGALSENDLLAVLERATEASLHTAMGAMEEGYLNYRGLRIGICGNRFPGQRGFRSYNSLAIRIPGQHRGICKEHLEEIKRRGYAGVLVAAPPGVGKTTALRELIRGLSEDGLRIGVVDERNELAAYDGHVFGFDLGPRSDILTGVTKMEGTMMLLRAMNPQFIAMDEISREQDWAAAEQISGCGVGILASVHGGDLREFRNSPLYFRIQERHLFSYLLSIRLRAGRRIYQLEELKP